MNNTNARKDRIGATLILVSGVVFTAIFWAITSDNNEEEALPECNASVAYTEFARELENIADIKEMCGWINTPEQYVGCWSMPTTPSILLHTRDCISTVDATRRIHDFVEIYGQPIKEACKNDGPCSSYFSFSPTNIPTDNSTSSNPQLPQLL